MHLVQKLVKVANQPVLFLLDGQLLVYNYGCRKDFKMLNIEVTVNTKSGYVLTLKYKYNDSKGGIL